jgi:transposase
VAPTTRPLDYRYDPDRHLREAAIVTRMTLDPAQLPDDVATLKAMLIAASKCALDAETRVKDLDAEIEHLKLTIAKLQHERFGPSSERARLLDQLELQLGELVEKVAQNAATEASAASQPGCRDGRGDTPSASRQPRQKPARRPLPENLPRERRVEPSPLACPCCGGRLRKLGEDITETLEREPARWKVIQHVREKMTCRACEAITQPPAPSHPIARGRAGPQLLADVLFGKYGAHLPLNRQSDIYAREGIDLDVSTLADWVGACAATLMPLRDAIEKHVHSAERIHVDDTTVPVLAKNKCRTGRVWGHVRDDRPFGGKAAPAVVLYYSPTREGEHPQRQLAKYAGIMQVDAYSGYNALYVAGRQPGPIIEAACWAHGRRKLYELARLRKMPVAIEAVRRIDELFAIEREINGQMAEQRLAVRRERAKPLIEDLERWLRSERRKLSAKNPLAKAMAYSLNRWSAFTRFLDDGRICMSNNAAERAVRGIAVGRKNWTFCGSDSGGDRAAVMYTLIETAKLNDVDPRAWLADVLARIADHPASRIDELLPWRWKAAREHRAMAA